MIFNKWGAPFCRNQLAHVVAQGATVSSVQSLTEMTFTREQPKLRTSVRSRSLRPFDLPPTRFPLRERA